MNRGALAGRARMRKVPQDLALYSDILAADTEGRNARQYEVASVSSQKS